MRPRRGKSKTKIKRMHLNALARGEPVSALANSGAVRTPAPYLCAPLLTLSFRRTPIAASACVEGMFWLVSQAKKGPGPDRQKGPGLSEL